MILRLSPLPCFYTRNTNYTHIFYVRERESYDHVRMHSVIIVSTYMKYVNRERRPAPHDVRLINPRRMSFCVSVCLSLTAAMSYLICESKLQCYNIPYGIPNA